MAQPKPWNDWMRKYNRHSEHKCGECVCFTSPEQEQLCSVSLNIVSRNNNACSKGKARKTNLGGINGDKDAGLSN